MQNKRKLYKYMIYNILLIISYFCFVWKKWKFTSSPVHLFTFFARVFKTVKTAKGPVKSGFMRQMTGLFSDEKIIYSVLKKGPKNFGRYIGFCSPFRILYKIELTPLCRQQPLQCDRRTDCRGLNALFCRQRLPLFWCGQRIRQFWTGEPVNRWTLHLHAVVGRQAGRRLFFSSPFFWSFRALALTSP